MMRAAVFWLILSTALSASAQAIVGYLEARATGSSAVVDPVAHRAYFGTPDGRSLVVAEAGSVVATIALPAQSFTFAVDGARQRIVVTHPDGAFSIIDARSGRLVASGSGMGRLLAVNERLVAFSVGVADKYRDEVEPIQLLDGARPRSALLEIGVHHQGGIGQRVCGLGAVGA